MKKEVIAKFCDQAGINDWMLHRLNRKTYNNYIRVINYHEIYLKDKRQFESHLRFYSENFSNCNYKTFEAFLRAEYSFMDKPGIMLTFDDGFIDNYENAAPLLEKYGFTGYFMVSSGLIGKKKYMSVDELMDLKKKGHVIGCHTHSHHRMSNTDSQDILNKEITKSKEILQGMIHDEVNIFCWCFGDKGSYVNSAYKTIVKSGYKYAFMTDSYPIYQRCNPRHIQRTNIQTYWDMSTVKFQLCGFMDWWFMKKRKTDEAITT